MRKENGQLSISVDITCPHCEEYIDLMEIGKFQEEGMLFPAVLGGNILGCSGFDETCDCPECGKCFMVGEIYG